jgi:hypothetical protein
MSGDAPVGLAHSVKQRLLNLSASRGETFNVLLVRYGVERLLYRLTRSPHADLFVLKGAMLFAIWADKPHRPTQDLDLLGFGTPSIDRLEQMFREICATAVEPDGLVFDPASVQARPIREDSVYDGIRVNIRAVLGKALIPLQVDVGFGDCITPEPRMLSFGPLLDLPAPVMRTYPPETVIAEKLEAMLVLGLSNSRMKDYFDIWTLCRTMQFDGMVLTNAISETIRRRRTGLSEDIPIGLAESFGADAMKQAQWAGFLRKIDVEGTPGLSQIVMQLHDFLMPLIEAIRSGRGAPNRWPAGGPWT